MLIVVLQELLGVTLVVVQLLQFHQVTQMVMVMEILNTQYLVATLRYAQKI